MPAPQSKNRKYDVIVVGGGNAGLTAALSAHENGARVLVLEKAPQEMRGGNSRFTGGIFRCTFDRDFVRSLVPDLSQQDWDAVIIEDYTRKDYWQDLMRVTENHAANELNETLIENSRSTIEWMSSLGVEWELSRDVGSARVKGKKQRLPRGAAIRAKGEGEGLIDNLFRAVEGKDEIEVRYRTRATDILKDDKGRVYGVRVQDKQGIREIKAKAVILACGGFQANARMREAYLGPGWVFAKVRGTRFNTGDMHQAAFAIGALPAGHWSSCHATPIDAYSPPFGDPGLTDKTNRLSYLYGVMVNLEGKRFVDEGEDLNLYTYAKMGRAILKQPRNVAFQIFDQKTVDLLEPRYRRETMPPKVVEFLDRHSLPIQASSLTQLVDKLEFGGQRIEKKNLLATIEEFNKAAAKNIEFDPNLLDGKRAAGVKPLKSNWALEIDSPPYVVYPVTCGITFTFGGLKINREAQVLDTAFETIPGLYATGEITGEFFYYNYAGGAGLMRGAVFGRIAGAKAASYSKK